MEGKNQSNNQATNGQSTNDEQQNQNKQVHQEEKGLIHPDPILHPDPMAFDQEGVLMDPKTDYGFKFLFGTPENKDILMDFLNVLLKGERHITDLQFMNSELLDEDPEYRRCIFDIHCQEADGTEFIVEMQKAEQKYFLDRALFYMCSLIKKQGNKEMWIQDESKQMGSYWNYKLTPVYTICLLNYKVDILPKVTTVICGCDQEDGTRIYEKAKIILVQLGRFGKTNIDEIGDDYEKYLFLLTNMQRMIRLPERWQRAIFKKIFRVAKIASLTEEERERYKQSVKEFRDQMSIAEFHEEKGYEKGLAKGKAEGEAKGKSEGILEVAKAAKTNGLPIAQIVAITGLSEEIISNL